MWGRGPNSFFYMWISNCLGFHGSPAGKESACSARDYSSIPGSGRSPGEGTVYLIWYSWASPVAQTVKNPPAMWETWVQPVGWEDSLEEGMATYSSILAWRIPIDRGAWRVQSMRSQRVGHDWVTKPSTAHPVVLVIFIEDTILSPWELSWFPCQR